MSIKSKWHGEAIYLDYDGWRYVSDNVLVKSEPNRKCGCCGADRTIDGHDGCLGTLIGVKNACCGHGVENEAYVQFLDGESIHGKDAKIILDILKKYKK